MQWPKGQTIQWLKGQTLQWPKGQTMQWPKDKQDKQRMHYKTLHRKLMVEQHEAQ